MRIVLCCATARGLCFLKRLVELVPNSSLTVCSFREEPHEPPFLEAIQSYAEGVGATFLETKQVGAAKHESFWGARPFDLLFCISWRYLVPKEFYSRAKQGAFVFHDSLLPTYRGFSPTVWAIINGEKETGVTLFEMAEAVDSGPVVDQVPVRIEENEDIAAVMEKVTNSYLELLTKNLKNLAEGTARRQVQDATRATYVCKRLIEDNRIHWHRQTGQEAHNLIRAVTKPYPGAYCYLAGRRLIIWSAELVPNYPHYVGSIPGRIIEVCPGKGSIILSKDGQAILLKTISIDDKIIQGADKILNSLSMTLE
jgi:methionyl-tRNA formyltransferase